MDGEDPPTGCFRPPSGLLLRIIIESLQHLLLILLIPLFVRGLNFLLHIVEGVLEHLGELLAHFINACPLFLNLLLLLGVDLVDFILDISLVVGQSLNFLRVVLLSSFEGVYLVHQVLLDGLILPRHIRDNVHLRLALLRDLPLQHHFLHAFFLLGCFASVRFILLINIPSLQRLLHNHEHRIALLQR